MNVIACWQNVAPKRRTINSAPGKSYSDSNFMTLGPKFHVFRPMFGIQPHRSWDDDELVCKSRAGEKRRRW